MAKSNFFNAIPSSDGSVAILLYGDVGDYGQVDSNRVVSELMSLAVQYRQIDVRINSTGGEVFAGIAIYNALRNCKANITIYIDGLAASIAGIIALCGHPLYMSPHAKLMLHNVSGGAWGSASELRKTADLIESLQGDLSRMIAGRCKMTAEEVEAKYFASETDHWITASEALEAGLIDGIYDMLDPLNLADNATTDEVYQAFQNRLINYKTTSNDNDMAFLDELKKKPGFAGLSEAGILGRIDELTGSADKASALEQANASLEARVAELEGEAIGAFIDRALAEGRITEAEKPALTALMRSDRANAEALISARPCAKTPAPQPRAAHYTQESPVPSAMSQFAGKSWDELDKANLLGALKATDLEAFKALFKSKFGVEYKDN